MHKQPHRHIEKIADNRYWQNQPRMDGRGELGTPKDLGLEDYVPPTLTIADDLADERPARFDESHTTER